MSLLLLIVLFVNVTCGSCYVPPKNLTRRSIGFDEPTIQGSQNKPKQELVPKDVSEKTPELLIDNVKSVPSQENVEKTPPKTPAVSQIVKTVNTTTAKPEGETRKKPNINEMESGAVLRGVWVLVGISVLFMIYLATKNYCKRNKVATMIRKYGVDARTSEVQMTLLSLRDEEEDETVFDVNNVSR